MTLRVLIVDDHELVRLGVRELIEKRGGWKVCGEAANGAEAVEMAGELAPDVVILDILMPVMNGFEATEKIRRISKGTCIILLSIHEVPVSAHAVGADAFVSKAAAAQKLLDTIEQVARPRSRGTSA